MAMATLVSNHIVKPIFKTTFTLPTSLWLGTTVSFGIKNFHTSACRSNFWSMFTTSTKRGFKLRDRDKIPKDFTLIYKAPNEKEMRFGYPVVLGTLIAFPSLMLYKFLTEEKMSYRKEYNAIPFMNPEKEIWVLGTALFVFGASIFSVIFKYPFRIYKHYERYEYIGIFLSTTPGKLRHLHFKSATETKFRNPLYRLFMTNCQYRLNTRKNVLMLYHYFRTPADICEMLDPPDDM